MNFDSEDILIDDSYLDIYESEWIKDSQEIVDSVTYSVFQGTGDNSLVKLLIKEEIVAEL